MGRPCLKKQTKKPYIMVYTCNPSSGEGRRKFKASLGYVVRPNLKEKMKGKV
jgi:hypothetical protein